MRTIAGWILRTLKSPEDGAALANIRREVSQLCQQFPVPAAQLSAE
jgi:glycine hydroxymethyltransferase